MMKKITTIMYLSILCANFSYTTDNDTTQLCNLSNSGKAKQSIEKWDATDWQHMIQKNTTKGDDAYFQDRTIFFNQRTNKKRAVLRSQQMQEQVKLQDQDEQDTYKTSEQITTEFIHECKRAIIKMNVEKALAQRNFADKTTADHTSIKKQSTAKITKYPLDKNLSSYEYNQLIDKTIIKLKRDSIQKKINASRQEVVSNLHKMAIREEMENLARTIAAEHPDISNEEVALVFNASIQKAKQLLTQDTEFKDTM